VKQAASERAPKQGRSELAACGDQARLLNRQLTGNDLLQEHALAAPIAGRERISAIPRRSEQQRKSRFPQHLHDILPNPAVGFAEPNQSFADMRWV
jgi:hypothetical protein